MAKEGSVAPKERINITYKPATGDATEEVELPLKMLAIGDYTGRTDETPIEDRKPINIDKDNFNQVLKDQKVSLDLSVKNKLKEDSEEDMSVSLSFKNIKDFEPAQIVGQVPEMQKLLQLREALTALKGPLGNVPAFRKKMESIIRDPDKKAQLMQELNLGTSGSEPSGDE